MGGLISRKYRRENAMLHAMNSAYGSGGHKWAHRVVDILNNYDLKSVLDYGCGKGTLAQSIGNSIVAEYDPAIEGKTEASPADLVVCTDVLEHVEPSLIDNVLQHLSALTKRRLLFSIATKSAKKSLPDGRNAHLIVRPSFWWKEKLSRHFVLENLAENEFSFMGEGKPIHELPAIQSFPAWDEQTRFDHVKSNCARVSKRLGEEFAHDRTAILVCYGPSLKHTWPHVARTEGDIFTVSGAHGFMLQNGIIPYAQIDCDPRPHKAAQFGDPDPEVRYWLGSCIHPDYLDRLEGHDVTLWHLHNGQESADNIWSIEPEAWLCVGGGSVGLRSISLLYSQGYRHFEIHGMDCSLADGEVYAGNHLGKTRPLTRVRCGERWFESNLSLIDYARQFLDDLRLWPGATFRLHGDGLLQHMVNTREKAI